MSAHMVSADENFEDAVQLVKLNTVYFFHKN